MFFDLWKITQLKDLLEKITLNRLNLLNGSKRNTSIPLNDKKVNYLTNCREIALLAIKGTKPTFNSQYDNGIYMFPLQGGKNVFTNTKKFSII